MSRCGCGRCSECKWRREGWARLNKPKDPRGRVEQLVDMVKAGMLTPDQAWDLVDRREDSPLETSPRDAVMAAAINSANYPPVPPRFKTDDDFHASLRYATMQVPTPPWQYSIGVDMGYEPPPPPPKCPPSCSPVLPCRRFGCAAAAYLELEKGVAGATEWSNERRKASKRPRPEVRPIAAAGLTFSRWNGRVP